MKRARGLPRSARKLTPLLGAVLALAGCGGSSGTPVAGVVSTAAKARLLASADAICRRLNSSLDISGSTKSEVIAAAASKNAGLELAALAQLEALSPPAALAGRWRRILAYRRTLAHELPTLAQYETGNDTEALQTLIATKLRLHRDLHIEALRFGLSDCAEVG